MKVSLLTLVVIIVSLTCVHSSVVKRSGDDNLEALQTVVQQQASAIQTMQADLAALRTLKIDFDALKSQVGKLSKAVAFTVRFSHDDINQGISLSPGNVLRFDNVVTNIGNGYDAPSGMFTAPVNGVYNFFLTEMAPNLHSSLDLAVMKEGQVLDRNWAPGNHDVDDQGSSTLVTTRLQAGQLVWVETVYGEAVRGSYWTIFTGYLQRAE